VDECLALNPARVVISPGPGNPSTAGISKDVIDAFKGKVPILGVCLGHQSIIELFGGDIVRAPTIMHGKTSPIQHDGKGLFKDLPQQLKVTRYHSLVGEPSTLPSCLTVTSTTADGVIMGVRHNDYVIHGVQFHPESISTEHGKQMLANFLRLTNQDVTE